MSKKFTEIEKDILRQISCFIFDVEKQDPTRTNSHLKQFGITDIRYEPKYREKKWNIFEKAKPIVFITLVRPGIVIGSKGWLIEALTKHLQEKINKDIKIYIIENRINDYFINFVEFFNDDY